jgi:hypothetical protein
MKQELRKHWEFAAACQFIQLFMFAFGVEYLSSDVSLFNKELEDHIISGSEWIIAFQIKMIRKYVKSRMAYLE